MSKTISPFSAGLFAGLLLLHGLRPDDPGVAVRKTADAVQFDPSRPFGNAAPPSSRKVKKTARPGDDFVPKNPKLARERQG